MLGKGYRGIFNGEFKLTSPTTAAVYKFAEENAAAVSDVISKMLLDMLITMRTQLKDFLQHGQYRSVPSPDVADTETL